MSPHRRTAARKSHFTRLKRRLGDDQGSTEDTGVDELGPMDYLVVEFPTGAQNFTGEMAGRAGPPVRCRNDPGAGSGDSAEGGGRVRRRIRDRRDRGHEPDVVVNQREVGGKSNGRRVEPGAERSIERSADRRARPSCEKCVIRAAWNCWLFRQPRKCQQQSAVVASRRSRLKRERGRLFERRGMTRGRRTTSAQA